MKEEKIQLLHPGGKKAVKIDTGKYEMLQKAIISCLAKKGALTHTELLQSVNEYFRQNKIKFEGSVEWYMESVKLHLEANKLIHRVKSKELLKFQIVSS